MDSFLDRFYDEVNDLLADPSSTRRLTNATKYRDLYTVQRRQYERLMNATGGESMLGWTETDITIVEGQEFYPLPANFRQFISLQERTDSGTWDRIITSEYRTLPTYSDDYGIQIITSQDGFRVQPTPRAISAGDYTLVYLKGPGYLHNATAGTVSNLPDSVVIDTGDGYTVTTTRISKDNIFTKAMIGETVDLTVAAGTDTSTVITDATADYIEFAAVTGLANGDTYTIDADWCWLVAGAPGTDAGEIIKIADYYNGYQVRVYNATAGHPQSLRVMDYYSDPTTTTEWHFQLRHSWNPVPTGTISYEISPFLPDGYDSIFAMDVAIMNATRRTHFRRRSALIADRRDLWNACLNYVQQTTMDRAPTRTIPMDYEAVDPYDMGYSY